MSVRHKLHDGPFYVSKYSTRPISPKTRFATLAALSWAAERAGQSYGQFIIGLTEAKQRSIQEEFERFLVARKEEMAARQAVRAQSRVDIDAGEEATYILTDEDL